MISNFYMGNEYQRTKVLITVITYPQSSRGYQELVCTAGITESLEWVRLYPIDYRYLRKDQQYKKYQWIEIGLASRGKGNDNRKESHKPDLESVRILGEPLPTQDGWAERRKIIDQVPSYTLNTYKELFEKERTSLGIVRPSRVLEVKVEDADRDWKPEWQAMYQQLTMFEPQPKRLTKIPTNSVMYLNVKTALNITTR